MPLKNFNCYALVAANVVVLHMGHSMALALALATGVPLATYPLHFPARRLSQMTALEVIHEHTGNESDACPEATCTCVCTQCTITKTAALYTYIIRIS